MKIHVEAADGEMETRLEDAVRVLEALAGRACHEHLSKAATGHDHPEKDLEPLIPALRDLLARGRKTRDRIQATMLRKMLEVLDEAEEQAVPGGHPRSR